MASTEKTPASRTAIGWAVLALPIVFLALFTVIPFIREIALAFRQWNLLSPPRFAGLDNFSRLFQDRGFLKVLSNTFFSPLLAVRIILIVVLPLSLAFLFMQMRSGARLTFQLLLSPLIIFSGALVTAMLYTVHYNSQGLGGRMLSALADAPSPLADPGLSIRIIGNLLLANGLAYSLPLGTAWFLAMANAERAGAPDGRFSFSRFWSRSPKLIVLFLIASVGFALAGLEGSYGLQNPLNESENLITYSYRMAFQYFQLGMGAADLLFLVIPLLLLGLAFMLVAELGGPGVSIRFLRGGLRGKTTEGAEWNGGRMALTVGAGVFALICAVLLAFICSLPLFGSFLARDFGGERSIVDLLQPFTTAFFNSFGAALVSSLLCWALASAAGFAIGFLRPAGGKAALIAIGSFVFIGPTLLLVPLYASFRNLGMINTLFALILPCMVSPLGIVLYSWFFRGMREESGTFSGKMWGSFFLFSLPVLALFFLSSQNMTLLPLAMISNAKAFPLPVFLRQVISMAYTTGLGQTARLVRLSYLQYLIPFALVAVSMIAVFPKLALTARRKGEGPLAAAGGEPVSAAPAYTAPVEIIGSRRLSRGGYWIRWLIVFVIGIVTTFLAYSGNVFLALLGSVIDCAGGIYMIVMGVWRMHDVDRRGWFVLVPIYNLVLSLTDGTPGPNRFGDDPKGRGKPKEG